jgi:hypothetical protein
MRKKVSVVLFVIGVCVLAAYAVRAAEPGVPPAEGVAGEIEEPVEPVESPIDPNTPADVRVQGHVQGVWTTRFRPSVCKATIKSLKKELYRAIVHRWETGHKYESKLMCEILIDALGSGKAVDISGFSHPYIAVEGEGSESPFIITRVRYYVPEEKQPFRLW